MPHPGSRRLRNSETRCHTCGLPRESCICSRAPRPGIRTEFIIVSHAKEIQRSSNTARLAQLVMPGTKILLRGVREQAVPAEEFRRAGTEFFVLFPAAEATEIDDEFVQARSAPFVIVVPDGSWRQAARAIRREPGLKDLPRLKLPRGAESRYALRTQPAAGFLSTFEAIARVVGIFEGGEKQQLLESFLDEMVRRTLAISGDRARAERLP